MPELLRVVERAERVDAGTVRECWKAPGAQAGGEHQVLEAHDIAVGRDPAPLQIELVHRAPGSQLDAALVPEALRAQPERGAIARAGQDVLGQRRPLVRGVWLLAQQDDASRVSRGAQRLGATGAGEAGAHDHDISALGGHRISTSDSTTTVIAPIGHWRCGLACPLRIACDVRRGCETVVADREVGRVDIGAGAVAVADRAVDDDAVTHCKLLLMCVGVGTIGSC